MNRELQEKLKAKIAPSLWYKYFYEIPVKPKFDKVEFPKVNRKFT